MLPGCYTYNLAARGCKQLTTKEHQLPQSCCCRRAFTRDHPLSGFPAGQPPYLHGPVPDLPAPTAVPVQEVMVPFAFNSNLLIGSAPRTLPIRFSMTKMVLFFVVASLLASDPIISAPGAECMAMEAADGDNHAGPGRTCDALANRASCEAHPVAHVNTRQGLPLDRAWSRRSGWELRWARSACAAAGLSLIHI